MPERARILMADDASEMTVHFDPRAQSWLAVYVDPTDGGPAKHVLLRRATRLEGPWSEPAPLWRMPEVPEGDDPRPGRPFCYAGRAHPQLAPAGELLVTWVCNLFAEGDESPWAVLERLRTDRSLYRPRAVRLPVPGLER